MRDPVLEQVRRMRPPVPPASEEILARVREELFGESQAEPQHQSQSRRSWWLAACLVLAVGLVTSITTWTWGANSAAAVEVLETDSTVEIRFRDLGASEEEIQDYLDEIPIDIVVRLVPASPSQVGQLVVSSESVIDERVEWLPGAPGESPAVLRVPTDYRGSLELGIGAPTPDGRTFVSAAVDAELPGESLHCTGIFEMDARSAEAVVAERGLDVIWTIGANGESRTGPLPSEYENYIVVGSVPITNKTVGLQISETGVADSRPEEFLTALRSGC